MDEVLVLHRRKQFRAKEPRKCLFWEWWSSYRIINKQLGPNLCFDFILLNARMDFWPKLLQFAGVCITLPDQWIYCLTGLFSGPCHWKWRHWSLAKRAIHHLAARILGSRLCIAGFEEKSLLTNDRRESPKWNVWRIQSGKKGPHNRD